jgi:hypothetical protein
MNQFRRAQTMEIPTIHQTKNIEKNTLALLETHIVVAIDADCKEQRAFCIAFGRGFKTLGSLGKGMRIVNV